MAGGAGVGSASLLAGWVLLLLLLLLLGCGIRASPDTELLMQAPFAHILGWTAAADLCNPRAEHRETRFRSRYSIDCDTGGNVVRLWIRAPAAANVTLPPEWGNLTHLVNLTLRGAAGSLPSGWGNNGSFPLLHRLTLSHGSLSGSLPAGWGSNGSFPVLQELDLSFNSLSGSLPMGWDSNSSFPMLHALLLSNNSLNGSLPKGWGSNGSFPLLERLILPSNSLSGSLPAGWGSEDSFPMLQELLLSRNNLSGSIPAGWGSNGSFPVLQRLWLSNNSLSGSLPAEWGSNGSFNQLLELWLSDNSLNGSLPVEWGAPKEFNIPTLQRVPATVAALPYSAIQYLVLYNNPFAEGVPVEWTNNPHLLSGRIVLDKRLFIASRDSPDFAKGVCMDNFRYGGYRNWSIGFNNSELCHELQTSDTQLFLQDCLIPVVQSGLDPCCLDRTTMVVLTTLWSCFGMIVLLVCLEGRAVALLDRHGSHILDAILIATYAVAKGEKTPGPSHGAGTIFSRLPQKAAWFMLYFLLAGLALPALDVLCLAKARKVDYDMPVDAVFKVDLKGYQAMRLVIGAVFRTIPTAIVLTVIAARGNNPGNGTYFDATVVSVSLTLSTVQIIVAILQVRQRAATQQNTKSKLKLLWSVFTLKGLELLSEGDVNVAPRKRPRHRKPKVHPNCTYVPLLHGRMLYLLEDVREDVGAAAREGPRHRDCKGLPFCTTARLGPSKRKKLMRLWPVVKVRRHVQEE